MTKKTKPKPKTLEQLLPGIFLLTGWEGEVDATRNVGPRTHATLEAPVRTTCISVRRFDDSSQLVHAR